MKKDIENGVQKKGKLRDNRAGERERERKEKRIRIYKQKK